MLVYKDLQYSSCESLGAETWKAPASAPDLAHYVTLTSTVEASP